MIRIVLLLVLTPLILAEPTAGSRHHDGASGEVESRLGPQLSQKHQRGKTQYADIVQRSTSSGCWADALSALPGGCESMGEDTRARMAVRLANCQFEQTGLPTYRCDDDMSAKQCTKPMHAEHYAYMAYTNYFLHVDNICFYLQAEAFQKRMDTTVSDLASASEDAVQRLGALEGQAAQLGTAVEATTRDLGARMGELHATTERQHKSTLRSLTQLEAQSGQIVEHVNSSLQKQEALMQQQDVLLNASTDLEWALAHLRHEQNVSFAASAASMEAVHTATRAHAEEMMERQSVFMEKQESLIGSVDRVLNLQNSIVGHFFDIKAVLFFLSALIVSYIFTGTHRTLEARYGVLLIFFAEFALESTCTRMLAYHGLDSNSGRTGLRFCAVAASALFTMFKAYSYQDQNEAILNQLNSQHRDFERMLARMEQVLGDHRLASAGSLEPLLGSGLGGGPMGGYSAEPNKPTYVHAFDTNKHTSAQRQNSDAGGLNAFVSAFNHRHQSSGFNSNTSPSDNTRSKTKSL